MKPAAAHAVWKASTSSAADKALELRIRRAVAAAKRSPSLASWSLLRNLVAKRSDAQVERMERDRGLR